jgi:hypothetical protein
LAAGPKDAPCRAAFKNSTAPPPFHISPLWRKFFAPQTAMVE